MKRLRELRRAAGLTQTELGAAANVTQHTISDIESGRRTAHPSTARKLAAALGCEVADLYGETALGKAEGPLTQLHEFANALHFLRVEVVRAEAGEITLRETDQLFDDIEMLTSALPDNRAGLSDEEYVVMRGQYVKLLRRMLAVCQREERRLQKQRALIARGLGEEDGIESAERFGEPRIERKVEELASRVRRGEMEVEDALRQVAVIA